MDVWLSIQSGILLPCCYRPKLAVVLCQSLYAKHRHLGIESRQTNYRYLLAIVFLNLILWSELSHLCCKEQLCLNQSILFHLLLRFVSPIKKKSEFSSKVFVTAVKLK